jgi:hypothetical protein
MRNPGTSTKSSTDTSDNGGWGSDPVRIIGGGVAAIWAIGYLIQYLDQIDVGPEVPDGVYIGAMLSGIGLLVFLGIFLLGGEERMRNAIAASFVTFYLALLALLVSAPGLREDLEGAGQGAGESAPDVGLTTLGESVLDTFSTLVGTIVAFYFVSQAAVRIAETRERGKTDRERIREEDDQDGREVKT